MVFDSGAKLGKVHGLDILNKERAMRIAHAGRNRRTIDRQVERIHVLRASGMPLPIQLRRGPC